MRGLMMDTPLTITSLIEFAAANHTNTEIVSRSIEGPIHRYTYGEAYGRIQQLANALRRLGVEQGDRIATVAWNGYRHLELYYAVSGIGAICHTVNPRLFPEQLIYIFNHAADKYVFFDLTFVPLLEALATHLKSVKGFVVMTDRAHMPESKLDNLICYEELIEGEPATIDWPTFDENTASSLCYTSGTTGNPKGALYSHRSTVLHTLGVSLKDTFTMGSDDSLLPVVPMFHANAWGLPYACALNGVKQVFPGGQMDGKSIYELLDQEEVTFTAGVPTVWLMLLDYMKKEGKTLPHLRAALIGGSAAPRAMIEAFEFGIGAEVIHAWGMTEMSPVGTAGKLKYHMRNLPKDRQIDYKCKQGRYMWGVEMKIIGEDGKALPHDGKSFGELVVRGPWIASGYYNDEEATKAAFTKDGWFRTGDVSTIDEEGYMQIVDRSKDVIKSGGEWISSIDLENAAVGHPDVVEAAVIGIVHPKWDERPLLLIVPAEGKSVSKDDMIAYLTDKVAKWWLPDDVVSVAELPHTATGKLLKSKLRDDFKDYKLPTA